MRCEGSWGCWGGGEHSLADYDYSSSLLDKTVKDSMTILSRYSLHITAIFLPRIFNFTYINDGVSGRCLFLHHNRYGLSERDEVDNHTVTTVLFLSHPADLGRPTTTSTWCCDLLRATWTLRPPCSPPILRRGVVVMVVWGKFQAGWRKLALMI